MRTLILKAYFVKHSLAFILSYSVHTVVKGQITITDRTRYHSAPSLNPGSCFLLEIPFVQNIHKTSGVVHHMSKAVCVGFCPQCTKRSLEFSLKGQGSDPRNLGLPVYHTVRPVTSGWVSWET